MMKIRRIVIASLVLTGLLMGLSGCKKPGPAESAGKKVDQTVEKAGQQVDKAGKRIQDDVNGK